jgi:hypothetical protein
MKKPFLNKITFNDIRVVFFPKDFHEKYRYLGSVPWKSEKTMLHALVIAMDHEAKPKWCPRWFLRFLYLFGCDNSIVRVRNQFLCNLHHKLTKGIKILDYKTKWTHYDLRISLSAPEYLYELSQAIETYTYQEGEREDRMENLGV